MKKVAFFDLDKTIYNTHSFFQLVEYEIEKKRVQISTWSKIQELLEDYKSGKTNYSDTANKLLETFARDLKGQQVSDLYKDVKEFFSNHKSNFFPYFEKILPKLKENHDVYIITTNAQFVAEAIVAEFGLSGYIASEFEVVDGVFTGKIAQSLANGKGLVSALIDKHGYKGSIAAGDSENDIGMLELVEFPICISPNAELHKYASEKNWRIADSASAENTFLDLIG